MFSNLRRWAQTRERGASYNPDCDPDFEEPMPETSAEYEPVPLVSSSEDDLVQRAVDFACATDGRNGLPILSGYERDMVELGIRRLLAGGWTIAAAPSQTEIERLTRERDNALGIIETQAKLKRQNLRRAETAEAAIKAKTDEIERLRRECDHWLGQVRSNLKAGQDCLEKLEAAEASNKALREGLAPFANPAILDINALEWDAFLPCGREVEDFEFTEEHFRRARAIFDEGEPK